jgi:fatty-acyl-CoA synthase
MYHVNGWGTPYAAVLAGADLVLPGRSVAPRRLIDLIERERVSVTGAVSTVWRDLAEFAPGHDLTGLRVALSGGGPLPAALARTWTDRFGVALRNVWGMTEVGPVGTLPDLRVADSGLRTAAASGPRHQAVDPAFLRPGPPSPLVRLRVRDPADGAPESPRAGSGEVQASGPLAAGSYLADRAPDRFTADGWFRTGDLGFFDDGGNLHLTDRMRDVIKSGGEWISSVDLENAVMDHPDVLEAAVIGAPHPRWEERPVAFVVLRERCTLTRDSLNEHLSALVPRWWFPDEIVLVDQLPRNGTGKIEKSALRERYALSVDQV